MLNCELSITKLCHLLTACNKRALMDTRQLGMNSAVIQQRVTFSVLLGATQADDV